MSDDILFPPVLWPRGHDDDGYNPMAVIGWTLARQTAGLPWEDEALDLAASLVVACQLIEAGGDPDAVARQFDRPHKWSISTNGDKLDISVEFLDDDDDEDDDGDV